MTRTVSIRVDEENYEFLNRLSKHEKSDLSKAARELLSKGRVMMAVERYKKGEASLGKASEVAGLPVGQMITVLAEYGVKSNLEEEDYRRGLENLRAAW